MLSVSAFKKYNVADILTHSDVVCSVYGGAGNTQKSSWKICGRGSVATLWWVL